MKALQLLWSYSSFYYSISLHYYFLGFITNCSPGTYSALTGQSSIATCSPCPRSYYCPNYGTVTGFICPANSYCPQGTVTYMAYLCPAGTFNLLPGLYSATQCNSCPIGSYCVSPSGNAVQLFLCVYSLSFLINLHMNIMHFRQMFLDKLYVNKK